LKALDFLYVGNVPSLIKLDIWKNFLKSLGIEFRYESSEEIPDLHKSNFQGIRFSEAFVSEVYHKAKGVSPLMVQLQAVDFLYIRNKEYWPKLVMREGLHSAILHKHSQLSAREGGLIVGSGTEAKMVASILIELGFRHITFVENDSNIPKNFIEELKLNYFQINIEVIGPDKVILLPGIYSVIVNTWDNVTGSDLLTDLLYFNYLKEPGLVINLKKIEGQDSLIEEAQAINEKTIQRKEIDIFIELNSIRPFVELNEKKIRDFVQLVLTSNTN
jgi:hypothetical protein